MSSIQLTGRTARSRRRSPRGWRRGAAAAELAAALPLLVLMTFGSIQACNTIHLKQAITTAVFEGTRTVSRRGATHQSVTQRIQNVLDARRVENASIQISPPTALKELPPGTMVEITVTAPTAGNVVGPALIQFGNTISVTGRSMR